MGEASRNEEHAMVLPRQFDRNMTSESRRARAHVDGNVEDAAAYYPDELGLGMVPFLEMQSSEHAVRRLALIVLHEGDMHSDSLVEILLVEGLEEVSARIAVDYRLQNEQPGNICIDYFHFSTIVPSAILRRYWPYWFFAIGAARARSLSAEIQRFEKAMDSRQAIFSPCLFSMTSI